MIEGGTREISVAVTDASGVEGLIQPRSHVDVLFTRTGSMTDATTTTILEDVTVLSIGRTIEVAPTGTNVNPQAARPSNQTATLAVTPLQARKIELAKNQGKISLPLRNPLDRSTGVDTKPTTTDALGPDFARSKTPDFRNTAWDQLTRADLPRIEKKEAPKPRNVIDVYRGDKHVQEVFQ